MGFVYKDTYLCSTDRVRLVNGTAPGTGRVEVYTTSSDNVHNREWGTICDDNWDIQDARVICRQLGYPDALAAQWSAYYGQGTGRIWLDDLQCLGTELDLFACAHNGIGEHNCDHSEDASVECLGTYIRT